MTIEDVLGGVVEMQEERVRFRRLQSLLGPSCLKISDRCLFSSLFIITLEEGGIPGLLSIIQSIYLIIL